MRRPAIAIILSITMALLASGCLWGVVRDADSGAHVPGATVSYTDSEGQSSWTTTGAGGLYAFDQASGPAPAPGPVNFGVSTPGCGSLTEARLIEYNDNPNPASLSNFWEIQNFNLWCGGEPPPTPFTIHFIDVGQGDAILVEIGEADILVDGGRSGSAVLSYLATQNVPDIDLLVATHPHADHIGGLDDVLAQYDVLEVWTNGATSASQAYQDFAAAVTAEGTIVQDARRGHSAQFGGVTLTALHPADPLTGDTNGDSVVLRLSCGSVDVLLTGDATADSEASMLADASVELDADVLKVGHHGSRTSTTHAFLDAVAPSDAVISVGAGNTYGHPTQEVLDLLSTHGATVYRTDLSGTVVLTSDCDTYAISAAEAPPPPPPTATPTPPTIATPFPTATLAPPTPTPSDGINCSVDQYNCGDFTTCAEVMAVFNACPGDPNRLDGDNDGIPCESLCG